MLLPQLIFSLKAFFFPHDIKGMKHCTILGVQVMSLTSRVFLLQIKLLLDPHRPYLVNVQYHPVVGKTFLYDEIWGFCCTRKSGEKVDPQLQRLPLPVLFHQTESDPCKGGRDSKYHGLEFICLTHDTFLNLPHLGYHVLVVTIFPLLLLLLNLTLT